MLTLWQGVQGLVLLLVEREFADCVLTGEDWRGILLLRLDLVSIRRRVLIGFLKWLLWFTTFKLSTTFLARKWRCTWSFNLTLHRGAIELDWAITSCMTLVFRPGTCWASHLRKTFDLSAIQLFAWCSDLRRRILFICNMVRGNSAAIRR